ncbi:MAG: hypothetical protein WCT52_01600 [Candidatus Micrarchaeia archaeon]
MMVDAKENRVWQSEREKNGENHAWKEILERNIRKIDCELDTGDPATMLVIQLRGSGLSLMDVFDSDVPLKWYARQMSINSTGYARRTERFLQALEATRMQYEIAVELGKNLNERSFSGDEQHWMGVAREFVQFVEMGSGQPAEVFFNPMSSVFSIDKMENYLRVFRFQNDIKGITSYEFKTAVEKTDSRKIKGKAQQTCVEIEGQAKTPARVDVQSADAAPVAKNLEFVKKMEAAGLGAEARKILAYLEKKNTTLEKISEIELWRQSVSLFEKPRTSYDSQTGIGIANKIIEAAGKHAAAVSAKEMKLTDWEAAFACYMHDNYRKRGTALEAIAHIKKNGISEEKIISLGENEIIGLVASMPCGYGSSRMYVDIDSVRKQLLRGIEYASKEERSRLKMEPVEYPCLEHKTTIRFEDIGSERHYRSRAGTDNAAGTETASQQSSGAGNAYFGGLPSGTTDVLALVRQRDAAIEKRKAWEKSHPGANRNNGKHRRH